MQKCYAARCEGSQGGCVGMLLRDQAALAALRLLSLAARRPL